MTEQININIHGIPGHVEPCAPGWSLHSKWASHTGYKHVCDDIDASEIPRLCMDHYESQVNLCYLVGDEHKDMGWKTIEVRHDGHVQIRIPDWASDEIRKALVQIGMTEDCSLNRYWIFPKSVTLKQSSEVLSSLLVAGTRFEDELRLASDLISQLGGTEYGYLQSQIDMFG